MIQTDYRTLVKHLLAYLFLVPVSRFAGVVGFVGKLFPVHALYWKLFDRLIGVDEARAFRDDHMRRSAEMMVEVGENVEESREDLVEKIEAERRQTEIRFSDGETALSLAIAVAAFTASQWVTLVLAVLLIISVSIRFTAIHALAYKDPDPDAEIESLKMQSTWNEDILTGNTVAGTLISLRLMKDIGFYERWLDGVFTPSVKSSKTRRKALKRTFTEGIDEFASNEGEELEDSEEDAESDGQEDSTEQEEKAQIS